MHGDRKPSSPEAHFRHGYVRAYENFLNTSSIAPIPNYQILHGSVLAISGPSSAAAFAVWGTKWYRVRPSFKTSNASSGESTKLKSFRSSGEIAPASAKASKFSTRLQ